jgi:predicted SprT family Zn-dependent metalloprotease
MRAYEITSAEIALHFARKALIRACDMCGLEDMTVRRRRTVQDEPYLCALCYLDVMTAQSKEKQVP